MIKYLKQPHTRAIMLYSYITEQINSGEEGDKIFEATTHKGSNLALHYRTDIFGGRGI